METERSVSLCMQYQDAFTAKWLIIYIPGRHLNGSMKDLRKNSQKTLIIRLEGRTVLRGRNLGKGKGDSRLNCVIKKFKNKQ